MRKLRIIVTALVILLATAAGAQASLTPQQEIDRDVWRLFEQSYGALNADAFLTAHAPEAIRIVRDSKAIDAGEKYHAKIRKNMATEKERGSRRTIELRFTERFADGNLAFDSGYYKVVAWYSDDESYTFYGQFDVILRKTDGRWKIIVDTDSSHGGTITGQDFMKGKRVGEY